MLQSLSTRVYLFLVLSLLGLATYLLSFCYRYYCVIPYCLCRALCPASAAFLYASDVLFRYILETPSPLPTVRGISATRCPQISSVASSVFPSLRLSFELRLVATFVLMSASLHASLHVHFALNALRSCPRIFSAASRAYVCLKDYMYV